MVIYSKQKQVFNFFYFSLRYQSDGINFEDRMQSMPSFCFELENLNLL